MFKDYAKRILTDRINSNLKTLVSDGKNNILKENDFVVKAITKDGNKAALTISVVGGDYKGDEFEITTDLITPAVSEITFPVGVTREQMWLSLVCDYGILITDQDYQNLPEKGEDVYVVNMSESYRYAVPIKINFSSEALETSLEDQYVLESNWWVQDPELFFDMGTVAKLWVRAFDTRRSAFDRAWDTACLVAVYRPVYGERVPQSPVIRTALRNTLTASLTEDAGKQKLLFVDGDKTVVGLITNSANPMYSWNLEMGHHVNIIELARVPWKLKDMWEVIDISGETLSFIGNTDDIKAKYENVHDDTTFPPEDLAKLPKEQLIFRELRAEDMENANNIIMYGVGKNDSFASNNTEAFNRYMNILTFTPEGEEVPDMQALNNVFMLYGRDSMDMNFYVHYELTEDRAIITSSITFPDYLNHVAGKEIRIKISYPITKREWEVSADEIDPDRTIDEYLMGLYLQDTDLQILKDLSIYRYASVRFTKAYINEEIRDKYLNVLVTGKSALTKTVLPEEKKTVYESERTGFKLIVKDAE